MLFQQSDLRLKVCRVRRRRLCIIRYRLHLRPGITGGSPPASSPAPDPAPGLRVRADKYPFLRPYRTPAVRSELKALAALLFSLSTGARGSAGSCRRIPC